MIHTSNAMTIKELPLRKKMQVDDNHPVKKVQKDVKYILLRNYLHLRTKV